MEFDSNIVNSGKSFAEQVAIVLSMVFLIVVFVFSGITKLIDPGHFYESLKTYKLFPEFLIIPIVFFVPWYELIVSVLLFISDFRKEASLMLSGLIACYLIITVITIIRGVDINCGCFGKYSIKDTSKLLLMNFILLIFSLYIVKKSREKIKNE